MSSPPYDPTETVGVGTRRSYGGQEFQALVDIPTGLPPTPIGDGSAADRAIVMAGRMGYARNTTGGDAFATLTVTTQALSGAGSFHQACLDAKAAGGGYIVWAPGTYLHSYTAGTSELIPSNTTVNGWGASVTFTGFGQDDNTSFNVGGLDNATFASFYGSVPAHDIIVTGLRFDCNNGVADSHGDVCSTRFWARNIWWDHIYATNPQKLTDGLFDITHCDSATVSWCDFYLHHKAVLTHSKPIVSPPGGSQLPPGVSAGSPGPYTIQNVNGVDYIQNRVTYVHCLFDSLAQRGPECDYDTTYIEVNACWTRLFGGYNDGTNTTVNGLYNWPTTSGARWSEVTLPGPSTGPGAPNTTVNGQFVRNSGSGTKINATLDSVTGAHALVRNSTYTNLLTTDTNSAINRNGGCLRTSGNTYTNATHSADGGPSTVPDPPYTLATIPATAVTTTLRYGVGIPAVAYWGLVAAIVDLQDFPLLSVEIGFNIGANTANYWAIEDPTRGIIGTFSIAGVEVFTDVTSFVQSLALTAGSSSRLTTPLVSYEAGTARISLDNRTRAFDPLNTLSPFYVGSGVTIVPVPGTLPNAEVVDVRIDAFDAGVSIIGASSQAAAGRADVQIVAFAATVTGTSAVGPTPNGILFGASHANYAQTIANLNPKVIRTFETFPSSYANTSMMKDVDPNLAQICSFVPDLTVLSDTASPSYGTITPTLTGVIGTLYRVLSGLSDIKYHYVVIKHEPVGSVLDGTDGNYTKAQWRQSQINFKNDVLIPLNATRTNKIFLTQAFNGYVLGNSSNVFTPTAADVWFTPAVCAVLDAMGMDCYGYDNVPPDDQVAWSMTYAQSKGLPLTIPELGYTIQATPGANANANNLATMQKITGQISAQTVANRPVAVSWFNNRGTILNAGTTAQAYWKNVCTNSTVFPS